MDALMIPIVQAPKATVAVEIQTPAGKKTGLTFSDYMEKKLSTESLGQGNLFGLAKDKATPVFAARQVSSSASSAPQEGTSGPATLAALLGQFVQYLQKSAGDQKLGPGEWSFPVPDPELLQKIARDAGMNEGQLSMLMEKAKSQDGKLAVVDFLESFARHFQALQEEIPVTAPETDLPLLQILLERLGVPVSEVNRISEAAVRGDNTFDLQKVADLLQGLSGERITDLTAVEAEQLQNILAGAGVSGQLQRALLPERLPVIEGLVESGLPVALTLDRLKNMLAQGVHEVKANRLQAEPLSFLADLHEVLARSGFETNGPRLSSAVQGTLVAVFEELMESVDFAKVKVSRGAAAAESVGEKKDQGFWQEKITGKEAGSVPASTPEPGLPLLRRLLARLGVPESEAGRLSEAAGQGDDGASVLRKVVGLLQGLTEERISGLPRETGRPGETAGQGDDGTFALREVAGALPGLPEERISGLPREAVLRGDDDSSALREVAGPLPGLAAERIAALPREAGQPGEAAARGDDDTSALRKVAGLLQRLTEERITGLTREVSRLSEAAVRGDDNLDLQKVADLLQGLTRGRISDLPAGEAEQPQDPAGTGVAGQLPRAPLPERRSLGEGLVESGPPAAPILDRLKNMLAQGVREIKANRLQADPLSFLADLHEVLARSGSETIGSPPSSAVQGELAAVFEELMESVDLAKVRVSRGSAVAGAVREKNDPGFRQESAAGQETGISGKTLFAESRGVSPLAAPVTAEAEAVGAIGTGPADSPLTFMGNSQMNSSQLSLEPRQDSALAAVFGENKGPEHWQESVAGKGEVTGAAESPETGQLHVEGRDALAAGVSARETGTSGELFVENSGVFQGVTAASARAEAAAPAASQAARPFVHVPNLPPGLQQQGFAQLSQGVLQGLRNQEHHLVLKLYPKELGEVKVEMTVRDNQVAVSFAMENSRVKEVLESNLEQFKENMEKQGFSLGECMVSLRRDNNGNEAWRQFQTASLENGAGRRRTTLADLPEDILYQRVQPGNGRESGVDLFA